MHWFDPDTGEIVFELSAPDLGPVHVLGDFNEWRHDEFPLRHGGGIWQARLALMPGRYRYAFQFGSTVIPAGEVLVRGSFEGWSARAMLAHAAIFTCCKHPVKRN